MNRNDLMDLILKHAHDRMMIHSYQGNQTAANAIWEEWGEWLGSNQRQVYIMPALI